MFIIQLHAMDLTPFYIEFRYNNENTLAQIKPCCKQDDVFYYDVSINNQFQFTITPGITNDMDNWKIALKNADKQVDEKMVQVIGEEIDRYYVL